MRVPDLASGNQKPGYSPIIHDDIPNLEHQEGTFAGCGGMQLFCQAWLPPPGRRRAVIVNLHGLGDHSGLYPNLAGYFPARGFALHAYDMRGNGRSPGQRAYLRGWHEYRDDLHAFLARVREWEGEKPLFLLGNSLGGLVVLDYALHHPGAAISGVIAAAPPLGELGVPPFLMALGRFFSRILPRFSLHVGMDLAGLAKDPAVIERVLADPYFHRRGTARLSTEVLAAIDRVQAGAARFPYPLLILHGSDDRMVLPEGSRQFFAKVLQPDRQFREYPGGYHGLFADFGHPEVLQDVQRWIEGRIQNRGSRV
jgi:alpha-beta hydrolase superfamily lysophospholipase